MNSPCETSDLLVFSHLRWDFLVKRPQHLMSRYAQYRRVFYFEEPVFGMTELPRLHLKETTENVLIVIPYLPTNIEPTKIKNALIDLVDELIYEEELIDYSVFYYNPMAFEFTNHLEPKVFIYDCIEDFSTKMTTDPAELIRVETEMMKKIDLMFISGHSLYESKKQFHHNIHPIPNAFDYAHFSQSRAKLVEPDDQINIPKQRIGYYGALDETFDFSLLDEISSLNPQYQFVIIGPAVNTNPRMYPRRANIYYLGKKDYHALPLYLSGWECTIMPLKINERTKLISPSKMYEFLASGKPLISTPISEIIHQAGMKNIVEVVQTGIDFCKAIERAMQLKKDPAWLDQVDHFLRERSWDINFNKMIQLERQTIKKQEEQVTKTKIIHPLNLSSVGVN